MEEKQKNFAVFASLREKLGFASLNPTPKTQNRPAALKTALNVIFKPTYIK